MNQRSIKMDNAAVTAALFGSFDVNTRIRKTASACRCITAPTGTAVMPC